MPDSRYLIVNADDFGASAGVNRGVIEAHERGIVTSASLMVMRPAAADAARYARDSRLSLGLHVELGEWVFRSGKWHAFDEVPAVAMGVETHRQLDVFRALTGGDPTHLDSHQHVHRREPARSIFVELAAQLGVPLRELSTKVRYRGDFYGQGPDGSPLPDAIAVDGLIELLRSLPKGVTELGCHPGLPDGLESSYLEERSEEIETLCDPRVRAMLTAEGIELQSFRTAFDE